MHHLMQAVSKLKKEIKCIANYMGKHVTFSVGGLCFIDSLHFLQGSPDSLVSATPKESLDQFYNKLNDEHITVEEYARTQMVWQVFSCKNLGDYHDLYVETDVALLEDVFKNFRKICLTQNRLDPAHYYTSKENLSYQF